MDVTSGGVTLSAVDASRINADAGAVAAGLSLAQKASTNITLSVGAAAALNEVANVARAAMLPSSSGVESVVNAPGDIVVDARSASAIDALTFAGSLSATLSGQSSGVSANLAGAGAGSGNSITNTVEALITGGNVQSTSGAVQVQAADLSIIHADAGWRRHRVGLGVEKPVRHSGYHRSFGGRQRDRQYD